MLSRLGKKIGQLRNALSRSEWAARHLRGPAAAVDHEVHAPGVLLLQIDGLGYEQLRRAMERNTVPFLRRLVRRDHFVLRKFYSGLPSTTAAVQAELFYGVKSAVPAVNYYDRLDRREKNMLDARDVDALAARLETTRQGLLRGGSSYSNIFAGGAREALFCIQTMNVDSIFQDIPWRKVAWFCLLYFGKILRIIGLSLIEIGLAVYDLLHGIIGGRNPFMELKFILSRIVACIILRELVRVHVKMDIAAGLPIIHANFLGYDEHSHRRGPSSAFAHWTLKGIDGTIKDIMHKAMRSHKRDYHIIIYADHGQEATAPFAARTGTSLRQVIGEVFGDRPFAGVQLVESDGATPYAKLNRRAMGLLRASPRPGAAGAEEEAGSDTIFIAAMGPLGHIYLPVRPEGEEMHRYARLLVSRGIPLVCYVEDGEVRCASPSGDDLLAAKGPEAFGEDHPFLGEVTADFEQVCRHAHAGDFIISGWQPAGDDFSLTFPVENGSHGGPGCHETTGFVILPDTAEGAGQDSLRPLDLRLQVKTILAGRFPSSLPAVQRQNGTPKIIKVMSYNIHSCLGMDGKLFPARIARIIGRRAPDLVALQEVDRHTARSGNEDQASLIGEQLGMHTTFFALLRPDGGGEYGLAILSRYPIKEMSFSILPRLQSSRVTERRGLMWLRLDTPGGPVHFFNTHLSYFHREGYLQMRHIVKGTILDALPDGEPVIFCGDLNSGNNSRIYSLLSARLHDSHKLAAGSTFVSTYPFLRLDYIFHSRHLAPVRNEVINDWECRLASDHLPVLSVFVHDPKIKVE